MEKIIEIEYASSELKEKLYEELGMSTESVNRDIKYLKQWMNQEKHLPKLPDNEKTDQWLERILFTSKNRMERCKSILEMYFAARVAAPEFYTNRDPMAPGIKRTFDDMYIFLLPKLTPEGYRVAYFGRKSEESEGFDSVTFLKSIIMAIDVVIKDDIFRSIIAIFDFNHSKVAHWAKYSPSLIRKFTVILQKSYPQRIKSIIIIHAKSYVATLYPLFSEKVKKRVKIFTGEDVSGLRKEIPADLLPEVLGGTMKCTLDDLNRMGLRKLQQNKDWFAEQEMIEIDKELVKKKSKTSTVMADMFALEGSFRKLDID